ncbi:hypothetical protein ACFOGJ_29255 [Marinibaculum pumilum]|uniref:Uncharacterized protein n=1 Tax=Marinibaculum pumilum TaxID=1766165 RepID=A0ABV7L9K0_9PROT
MARSTLYLLIVLLVVGVAVLGVLLYQEEQQESGVEIDVGKGGISVETK